MTPFPFPPTWDRAGLESIGFSGFVPFTKIREPRVLTMPKGRGIYVVIRQGAGQPTILPNSLAKGGWYDIAELAGRWIADSPILYIGKADGSRGIHHRLKQYARRGNSHTGGRAIWQLADADDVLVAWAETPGELGRAVEKRWIARYVENYGRRPFANVND